METNPAAELEALATALVSLGCPEDRSREMASQLERRAGQLSEATGRSREEALVHLLRMMAGGWAANRGPSGQ